MAVPDKKLWWLDLGNNSRDITKQLESVHILRVFLIEFANRLNVIIKEK